MNQRKKTVSPAKRGREPSDDDCAGLPHSPSKSEGLTDPLILERASEIFRALGDTPRLKILERLSLEECCVSELAAEFDEEISTVSQRLRLLRRENLVKRRRQGKHFFYRLADSHVTDLIRSVMEHANEEYR